MKRFFREVKRINWGKTLFGSIKRTAVTLILVIPVFVFAASFGYKYYLQQNPAVVYAHKLQTMTDKVGKSVTLPKDETPVVATVTDTNLLPKEIFFSHAKNGDKILMYKKHKLAVLFRPSLGVVVTQAVLDFRDVKPTPSTSSGSSAVAGASTSASSAPVPTVSPTPDTAPADQSSRPNAYQPQGKVLVVPRQ
jgi:hypothetical protein